jgi:hypothetical protein
MRSDKKREVAGMMSSTGTELADVRRALGQLRNSIGALRGLYGDCTAVRRISNDLERLDIDVAELSTLPAPRQASEPAEGETVIVPDTPTTPRCGSTPTTRG